MLTKQAFTSLFTITALAAAGVNAHGSTDTPAGLPNGRTLTYDVRKDSALIYQYEMHVTAQQQVGNSIGWAVDSVTVREFDANEQVIGTWIDSIPNVASADGLWWATHADPANPVLSEFAVSPRIDGTAGADMDYEFEGQGTPAGANANVLVALVLWLQSHPVPDVDYNFEPLWVHDSPDPD